MKLIKALSNRRKLSLCIGGIVALLLVGIGTTAFSVTQWFVLVVVFLVLALIYATPFARWDSALERYRIKGVRKAPRGNLSAGDIHIQDKLSKSAKAVNAEVEVAGETNVPAVTQEQSNAEVSRAITLITATCEQTYRGLLAFNATLEAARAKKNVKGSATVVPTAGACSTSDAHNTQQAAAELARVSATLQKLALICGNSLYCLSTDE